MRHRQVLTAGALAAILAGSAMVARAEEHHPGFTSASAATVTGVTATITALNYDETGTTVDGLLVGPNVLLTFSRPVCGGIGSLGTMGNRVTYSGMALTFASGFQVVHVTSFTNGSITYPPAAPPKPGPYAATAGAATQLNYSFLDGAVDGFVFTPTTGPKVFVGIGTPSSDLVKALTVGAAVTVTGTVEAPPRCAATGTISEVDASSLMIGTTTYALSHVR